MSKTSRTLVTMPSEAKQGEIITIKIIVQHDMESGFRRTELGEVVPRDIIRSFICTYAGSEIFKAELHPGTGANPLISFTTIVTQTGLFEFKWQGDNDYFASTSQQLTVV